MYNKSAHALVVKTDISAYTFDGNIDRYNQNVVIAVDSLDHGDMNQIRDIFIDIFIKYFFSGHTFFKVNFII